MSSLPFSSLLKSEKIKSRQVFFPQPYPDYPVLIPSTFMGHVSKTFSYFCCLSGLTHILLDLHCLKMDMVLPLRSCFGQVTSCVLQAYLSQYGVFCFFSSSLTLNNFQLMVHHTLETLFYSTRDHNYSACHYTADSFYVQNLTFTPDELHCILPQTIALILLRDSVESQF